MNSNEMTNLLWTGGWDSTFRLLHLLLVKHRQIQPYYIIDADRKSTQLECRAMQTIKQHLFVKYPKTKDLLRPTRYIERFDITPNEDITQSFKRIAGPNHDHLGSQYDWLARFVHETGIEDMELPLHYRDGKAYKVIEPFVVKLGDENDPFFKIDPRYNGSDEYTIFKYFRFPILDLTTGDMELISHNEDFYDFMELTWFCHRPRPNGVPCGVCNPCVLKLEEGLSRRIPFSSRVRYHLRFNRILRVVIQVLIKYPRLHSRKRNIEHGIRSN